ncbi:MAG: DUF86 domain-containing protein [Magnetospirillum sp. WYHS-4]
MRRLKELKRRDWKLRIDDILHSLERIESYIAGLSRDAFVADERTVDAVTRNIEIIGEAAHYVPGAVKKQNGGIPWDKLRKLRNYLAHEYFGVDRGLVWETATRNLPPLRPALIKALRSEPRRERRG